MANPIRTCVGCGAKASPAELVRLRAVGGEVRPDVRGGRGAWLHASPACLERAGKRRAFGRALRDASVRADLASLRDWLTRNARKD
ncbi:MAG TPA: YlxR family protein [Anaeromyxobacteraceae bacterium]|nr:YlxR family protein [Anaeromyxobacteraceae bacterium]